MSEGLDVERLARAMRGDADDGVTSYWESRSLREAREQAAELAAAYEGSVRPDPIKPTTAPGRWLLSWAQSGQVKMSATEIDVIRASIEGIEREMAKRGEPLE